MKSALRYRRQAVGILLSAKKEGLEDRLLARHPFFVEVRAKARCAIAEGKFVGRKELEALRY